MRIYLTGFMGAGKTTVGRMLAQKLNCDFYDLDQEIEREAGKQIPEIFHSGGESGFRSIESAKLRALLPESAVIATGGGCFIENCEWMLNHGVVVYLKVPFEQLVRRIGADPTRPLWKNAATLFQQREPSYCKAHFTVDANASPEAVVQQIVGKIQTN
jgi:shikimate kinase